MPFHHPHHCCTVEGMHIPRGKMHDWLNHNCPRMAQGLLQAVMGPLCARSPDGLRRPPWNRSFWPPYCRRGSGGGGVERRVPDGAWGGAGTNPDLLTGLYTDLSLAPSFPFFPQSKQALTSLNRR